MRRTVLLIITLFTLAIAFGVEVAVGILYSSRHQASEWNEHALTAKFHAAFLEGDPGKESPVFFYVLENHTGKDYSAESPFDLQMLVRNVGALDSSWLQGLAVDLPIFIPEGEKANATVHFRMIESEQPKTQTPADVQRFILDPKRTWYSFNGFVLLDKRYRYRVRFPVPWR